VGAGVVFAQVVGIIGDDERDAGFDGEAVDLRGEALILLEAVILNFEEVVVFAEEVAIFVGEAAGVFVVFVEDGFVDVSAEAGGEADEAFGVAGEEVFIDAGL